MFDFLKKKKTPDTSTSETTPVEITSDAEATGFFKRLKQGLTKTRASLSSGIATIFLGKKELTQDLINDIEMLLISADVGFETTQQLLKTLTNKLARKELSDPQAAFKALQDEMKKILMPCEVPLKLNTKPFVILVVGINGSGKTTTIGKIANYYRQQRYSVMLAAGDTFRAAAIEQLQIWGERNQIPVIAQHSGADTAAVIYDSLEAASARQIDILVADTAGRLHTQSHLMSELKKVNRVLRKLDPSAPHETLIVLDASLGQNALNQVKQFHAEIGISGIAVTKLDGTAKGGIIFALAKETGLPIRFIGVGEGIEDLRPFNASEFVDALFTA